MPRGRLIFPLLADIAPLDVQAMEAAGDYDSDFREPGLTTGAGGEPDLKRTEGTTITIKAQVERDRLELQRLGAQGDIPDSAIGLVVHMRDMERAGLVDSDGRLKIKPNDRLVRLKTKKGTTVLTFDEERGGLYCTHVTPLDGWIGSLGFGQHNLRLLLFSDRPQGGA